MQKQLVKYFFLIFIVLSFTIFVIVFVIDPFQHYRKATSYPPVYHKPNYLNPGLAKNYNFDSVLLGSSMAENFLLSDISDKLNFQQPIKLTTPGASAHTIKTILSLAFKHHNINNVLLGLDVFSFSGAIDRGINGFETIPTYLYDDTIINDYKYIFNINTLFECARPFIYQYKHGKQFYLFDYDKMYTNTNHTYKESKSLHDYHKRLASNTKSKRTLFTYNHFIQSFSYNILPIIEEHPETNFILFYPPYSILQFKEIKQDQWLSDMLKFKFEVYKMLKKYPNVKLFDFQAAHTVTHNLNNYKDISHYSPDINKWILHEINKNRYRVDSLKRVSQYEDTLLKQIGNFTLLKIYQTKNKHNKGKL